ncbi:MAG: ubiquitin-conjugating enzyme E2 [Planctomycetales bacterium]|jgi:ubiquitin-protein ligase
MSTVRLRRLTADYARLSEYTKSHPRLKLMQTDGDPPERYHIEYRIRSLRQVDGDMRVIKSHTVEILLPRNYPRTPPQCRMLTPVFHPNIAPHAICVGDHWSPGESLESLVGRIGEMLAYQSYNVKSPLNGEAARWVAEHEDELPLDPVSMIIDESRLAGVVPPAAPVASSVEPSPPVFEPAPPAETYKVDHSGTASDARPRDANANSATSVAPDRESASQQGQTPQQAPAGVEEKPATLVAQCPACDRKYRVPLTAAGRKANCSECDNVFQIPSLSESN